MRSCFFNKDMELANVEDIASIDQRLESMDAMSSTLANSISLLQKQLLMVRLSLHCPFVKLRLQQVLHS